VIERLTQPATFTSAGSLRQAEDDCASAAGRHAVPQFQGYSTHADCDLIGSRDFHRMVGDSYSQNLKDGRVLRPDRRESAGGVPGRAADADDRLRRAVITELILPLHPDFPPSNAVRHPLPRLLRAELAECRHGGGRAVDLSRRIQVLPPAGC